MGKVVKLLIPAYVSYSEADGFDVFFDDGGGSVDYGNPMNGHRVGFWPGAPVHSGCGLDGYGVLPRGDSVSSAGWGEQAWGYEHYGYPAILRVFETWPLEYGTYRFAVKTYDGAGNSREDAPVEQTILVEAPPQPPANLGKLGYDEATDQLTLGWDASPSFS